MARWNDLPWREDVYAAAEVWKERCLLQDGALLSDTKIWNIQNINELFDRVIQNSDQTPRASYLSKLEKQLAGTKPEISQLAAEAIYVIYLCPLGTRFHEASGNWPKPNIRPQTKRDRIKSIFSFGGMDIPTLNPEASNSRLLDDTTLSGLCNVGPGLVSIHTMIEHLLLFLKSWKIMQTEEQKGYLAEDSAWLFGQWFDEILPPESNQLMRNQILHLLFPNHFERIIAKDDKIGFLRSVIDNTDHDFAESLDNPMNIDRALYESRPYIQEQLDIQEFDFYVHQESLVAWIEQRQETASFAEVLSKLNDGIDQVADMFADQADTILGGVAEGKRKVVAHAIMERRSQRKEKIREFKEGKGKGELFCECFYTKSESYPRRLRERTFEVHHRVPLANLQSESQTSLADLAVLCANCHRAIHTFTPPEMPSVEEFRALLNE